MEAAKPGVLALLDEVRLRKFYKKVLRTERASLISFLPLWEASGSVAADISGNGTDGAYVNVTLGQPGPGDGRPCPLFDGSTSYINWYSAALAALFNGAEGTLLFWDQVANAGVWTDGVNRRLAVLQADSSNLAKIQREGNNQIVAYYTAGGISKVVPVAGLTAINWMCWAVTWSKSADAMKVYLNGLQQGVTQTGLGTWAGSLASTTTVIGANTTAPAGAFFGCLARCLLSSKTLTPAQIAYVSKM